MEQLDISFGKNRTDTNWKVEYLGWEEFIDRARKVRRTSETMAQYDAMTKEQAGSYKGRPGLCRRIHPGRTAEEAEY
ncbi:hypothetical protein LJK88_20375 [Paenibacillus sp. P26]|nr:hypothetical protein LJK88_20375 [Paenibacillus sp. P26]